jgi:Lon protease-like protein
MKPDATPAPKPEQAHGEAAQHVVEAHNLLSKLRDKLEKHPELEEAIERLEMALSALTVKTGAML